MRSILHWTPRYFRNRLAEKIYRRMHPDYPWLAPPAIRLLDAFLHKNHVGLESGSGGSTIWFARRVAALTSVENNRVWYDRVSQMMAEEGIANVSYHLCEEKVVKGAEGGGDENSPYVKVVKDLPDGGIDFALVDGIHRGVLANILPAKLRPGGALIVDNVERYLPSASPSPESCGRNSGVISPRWARFKEVVQDWRCVWSSNGVYDTAIFFKPNGRTLSC